MNKKAYILAGMFLGDEGKGTFADYLAHEKGITNFVKYNGGSQASHTVVTKDITHKFSQLSSGMLDSNGKTYLSSNTVVNPMSLLTEIEVLSEKIKVDPKEILNRVSISTDAYIVTPYHKLINRLKELSSAYSRRGSVGTGVSEVLGILREIDLGIQFGDLYNEEIFVRKINQLKIYTSSFLATNFSLINNHEYKRLINQDEVDLLLGNSDIVLNQYLDMISNIPFNITSFSDFISLKDPILFEGTQGLLLDYKYGIRPNTTLLDTTNKYAETMIDSYNYQTNKVGITSSFASRHGLGILPTETKDLLITDKNQEDSYWQGKPRYGWFDAVLFRYSQSINSIDEIYLSALDLLGNIPILKVCNEYEYDGEITEEFTEIFNYYKLGNQIIVTDIKKINDNITFYLKRMQPIYIKIKGWTEDISNIKEEGNLPTNCLKYIEKIEELTGIKISLISIGPMREQKIRRKI